MTTHADLTRQIDAHLQRAAQRVRARRLVVTLSSGGLLVAVVGAITASWEAWLVVSGGDANVAGVAAPFRVAIVIGLVVACAVAWTRGVSRATLARDVDQRLGLADRTATAVALANGTVTSALRDRVLADTSAALDAAGIELERAFPASPRRATLHLLRAASVAVAIWVAIVLASRFVGSGGGGQTLPGLPGTAPVPAETADGDPGTGLPPDTPDQEPEPEPGAPEGTEPEPAPPDPDVVQPEDPEIPEPEAPPAGPQATAQLVLSATEFDPGDDILTLAVAKPGAGLTAPKGFVLSVEVDGTVLRTGDKAALDPGEARGTLSPLRLGRLAGAEDVLKPGEHEAVLLLEPEGGGAVVRSEPVKFKIRGDKPGDGDGQPPPPDPSQPPPQPEQPPEPPPPPPAQPEQPEAGGGDEQPPDEGDPPPMPEKTERKVVVPLFGEGEEIEKIGPRLVLVPGGGPESPPRRVPLEEAWDEAQKRAESFVDRAGVRAEDRDLVRRYFERLRKLAEGGR